MAILSNKSLFQYPRTPAGKASLLDLATESTHRIVGDRTGILFEADPDVVRETREMERDVGKRQEKLELILAELTS